MQPSEEKVSTHMPLTRHDRGFSNTNRLCGVSTHMPLTRHDSMNHIYFKQDGFLLTCLLRGMTYRSTVRQLG